MATYTEANYSTPMESYRPANQPSTLSGVSQAPRQNSAGSNSPRGHVSFINKNKEEEKEKRQKYLTAKYGQHQMMLIRKRLAVEDWIYEQLRNLYCCKADEDDHDCNLDLEDILNLDTDAERREYAQTELKDAKLPQADINISDIHISKFWDQKRSIDMLIFCRDYLAVINPDFVIATGDLTDAKLLDRRGSQQFYEEWRLYRETVMSCKRMNHNITWLDIRGNHDSFDVPSHDHTKNLFRKYSFQGQTNPSSYHYKHVKPYGTYSFLAMDATPNPGPKRPFNFFGFLSDKEKAKVKRLKTETYESNKVVWFGHYTTSLIVTEDGQDVRALMRDGSAYLCGHLHTLADLVPKMYTLHKTGLLELELGDWKDNRKFRVLAIDHDTLSFTDTILGEWPAVIITNPVNAQLASPVDSPDKIKQSTHIRILVFSPFEILKVWVSIDGLDLGAPYHVQGPLYVLPWDPSKYATGIHEIKVTVEDGRFNYEEVIQPFSMDGSRPGFDILPRLVLMMNIYNFGKLVFQVLATLYIVILILLRRCDNVDRILVKTFRFRLLYYIITYVNMWIKRVWYVTRQQSTFYLLLGFMIYIWLGPWFVAEIIEGHVGVVFIWGMYVSGTFIPGSLTYIYGVFQIIIFNVPILLFLGYMIHYNSVSVETKQKAPSKWRKYRHIYIPFCAQVLLQTYVAITEFPKAYGTRAFLLGPVRTGSVILAFVLFYLNKDVRVKPKDSKGDQNKHRS
ncbi:hypothetical protein FSP39_008820 [Pinctada imbricata]|uniref:Calcineurin-like phosphoesterase domain-containing protein n=1 Tax=Pinctada imbricata TaxID=66713 RepID=A0AA88XVM7_PINIB|nr:hypothetical protein FSP39_008820 [Pinctada imbricata]